MTNKILKITSIAVLTTFIMTMAMTNVAQAPDPVLLPEEDFNEDIADVKCDESHGSFFNPALTGENIYTGSWADCSVIGQAGLTSAVVLTGAGGADHCITLGSPADLESFLINEKGYISFTVSVEQCFYEDAELEIEADPLDIFFEEFCGDGEIKFSTVDGDPELVAGTGYTMIDGLVDGKRVVGGTGAIHSVVDHCAGDNAPYGNSGSGSFHGDIHTVVEE